MTAQPSNAPTTAELVLHRSDVRVLYWHLGLYGIGAILEHTRASAGHPDAVRVSWTRGMQPRAKIHAPADEVATAIHDHALAHAARSWVHEDVTLAGKARGLMSPRLSIFTGDDFDTVQRRRHHTLDQLTDQRMSLDLRLLAALGEPAYWSFNAKGAPLQDDGASRWDMQPRNQGSELVKTRLRKLAGNLAGRDPRDVTAMLTGAPGDGHGAPGLPTDAPDSALSWAAIWGISQLPIAARINATALTSGHLGRSRNEHYYTPYWTTPWRPARLRSILTAAKLKTAASAGLARWAAPDSEIIAARAWLEARGVHGVLRFPIGRFGSDNAPERRALLGTPIPTTDPSTTLR
jgi:CRISPR-associated protein Csb3